MVRSLFILPHRGCYLIKEDSLETGPVTGKAPLPSASRQEGTGIWMVVPSQAVGDTAAGAEVRNEVSSSKEVAGKKEFFVKVELM